MTGRSPATKLHDTAASMGAAHNLVLRIVSGVVLAALALAVTFFGGGAFALFWTAVALLVWWEWLRLIEPSEHFGLLITGLGALAIGAALAFGQHSGLAMLILVLGALAAGITATRNPVWTAGGLAYAGALMLAPPLLRGDDYLGMLAVFFVFAVVWATDILAYFVGRAIGGPRLAPAISPNKTWSGAIGGSLAAVLAGLAVLWPDSLAAATKIALTAFVLSAISQAGDLFESHMKRQFDAKDSSVLIPGHGGVMDRVDGFVAAIGAAVVIGLVRSGGHAPAAGLIAW